jgi:hypothetical protein
MTFVRLAANPADRGVVNGKPAMSGADRMRAQGSIKE